MSASDRQLAQRIARGERAAFEEFLDLYGPRVHRLARRYAPGEADAEDLTQEIFLDLYRSSASFRGESSLATWVYRVALNHCLRHQEKQRARQTRESGETPAEGADFSADPARHAQRRELKNRVQSALDDLSPAQRDVVVLHELHGLTYGECAQVLGVPVGTVKSRLFNAFGRLRASLDGYVLGDADRGAPLDALGEAV
jgi:RNA polymerase sigma-70 factor, ECF subfamily